METLTAPAYIKKVGIGLNPSIGGAPVIQTGTITIGATATSATATITSVTTARAHVVPLGFTGSAAVGGAYISTRLELTNATTVTAYRDQQDGATTVTVGFMVLEWPSGVLKAVQAGTIAIGAGNTSATGTITAVVVAKSQIYNLGGTNVGTGGGTLRAICRAELTNTTTVTVLGADLTWTIGYVVVEFA